MARICQDEGVTIIISPRHLAHSMDKRTRANGNGDGLDILEKCKTLLPKLEFSTL
jgi:hypothetical protein